MFSTSNGISIDYAFILSTYKTIQTNKKSKTHSAMIQQTRNFIRLLTYDIFVINL